MADKESLAEHPYERAYFHSRYSENGARDTVWKAICGYLRRYIPGDAAVLDLGAGYCSFINHIDAAEKHALDVFPGFVDHAKPGVKTHVGKGEDLGLFEDQKFDAVFASNFLEHLTRESTLRVLSEVRRVLKTGGRFILLQPNFRYSFRNYFDDYTHVQIFTHVSLADLLASHGFGLEKVEPRFLPFSFKTRLPTWGWLVKLYLRLPFRPLAAQMLLVARKNVEQ